MQGTIMTSGDTNLPMCRLLENHGHFGLAPGQVVVVAQDKDVALINECVGLALTPRWEVTAKPHGHGDVHHLLHRETGRPRGVMMRSW